MNRAQIIESLERRILFNALVFSQPTSFATGEDPSSIAAADLTNNGKIDLVTADIGNSTVAILRGNGNGTFQAPYFYPVGASPESVAIADLNGDGIPDIITANQGANSISVLIGIGDGTFAPAVTYSVGTRPTAVAVADLNGDGFPDIVTTNPGSNNISVLLNAGNGTFEPAVEYGAGIQPTALAIGDVNSDGHPDIVTANPFTNNVHILLNNGAGGFNLFGAYGTAAHPRSVALVDVNTDARPDIVTGDLDAEAISVLLGNGNGTFLPTTNYLAGVRPITTVIADMNGDGRPDVVTADNFDNGVAVLLRTGQGNFAATKSFNAGHGPVAAVAADVNGDGRPDIIVADINTSSVSVLLNQTVFVPLVPSTATLTGSQNPVQVGNNLVLTVQVANAGVSTALPLGNVQFFDDGTVVAVGRVSTSGVAQVAIHTLAVGTHIITAHYGGDSIFAGSITGTITQQVIPVDQATPLVEPSITSVKLPTNYVPLDKGIASVAIRDAGAGRAVGTVHVQLYASTSSTFDSTAFPLVMSGSGEVNLRLIGNQTKIIPIGFTIPADIIPGNYTIFAALAPISGLTAEQVGTDIAVGLTTQQAVLEFGNVNRIRGVRLTRTLANGDSYDLRLVGPGRGDVTENADGGISIALTGTDDTTQLLINSTTGVNLDGLTQDAAIGSLIAPTTNLVGNINLDYGVTRVTLNDVSNCEMVFGGVFANFLTFNQLSNVNLFSGAPIHSLTLNSYTNQPGDIITTAWIDDLNCTGNFGPALDINGGFGGFNRGLNSGVIGGTVGAADWRILANVGSVKVGGVAAGWTGSVRGSIQSFIDTGDFAGILAAHNITLFQVDGNLTNADLLTGADFGNDGLFGSSDDTFGRGVLTKFQVGGSITNSVIAAGLKPGDNSNLLAPGSTLLPRSAIRSITVGGTVDTPTRFLSAVLPKTASIDGTPIATTNDPNFG